MPPQKTALAAIPLPFIAGERISSSSFPPKVMTVVRFIHVLLVCLGAVVCVSGARAADLDPPSGPVVLTITGNIAHADASGAVRFDLAALRAFPQHEVRTSTAWTDGVSTFSGPLLCDLLDAVGADGAVLHARALNDYAAEIPVDDCRRYPVILALERDGEALSRRDKGPIWIVYPQDTYPELRSTATYYRWVWQLSRLEVR